MDHLPIPKNPAGPLLQIPYICDRHYQGGPFLTYPKRRSVPESVFWDGPSSDLSRDRIERFMQEWMVFGLLHEMYAEFSISDDDFIRSNEDGIRVLDTSQLNDLARRWIQKHPTQVRREHGLRLKACLEKVFVCIKWAQSEDRFGGIDPRATWSIYAIAARVENVVGFETGVSRDWAQEFPLRYLDIVALENLKDVCSTEIFQMRAKLTQIAAIYYVSLLSGRISHPNDPQTCGKFSCTKQNVAKGDYQTRHADGCDGTCDYVAVGQELIHAILQRGAIPGISVSRREADGGLTLQVVECTDSVGYVAISHVWSDGMGNETSNALPQCQLERVFQHLANLRAAHETPMVFWMDTLCCPIPPDKGRDLAISYMQRTYENASAGLVLDSSLEAASMQEADDVEL